MICGAPTPERPYHSRIYDPFWAAAQELNIPISLHLVTGRKVPKIKDGKAAQAMPSEQDAPRVLSKGFSRAYMTALHEIQCTFIDIILGGVLERFPNLKMVSAENDTGWLPHFLYRLDHAFEKFGPMSEDSPLKLKPSEYVHRQLWATFQDDPVGPTTYKFFGEDNYMWASDFPHSDCTWPHSREVVERDFARRARRGQGKDHLRQRGAALRYRPGGVMASGTFSRSDLSRVSNTLWVACVGQAFPVIRRLSAATVGSSRTAMCCPAAIGCFAPRTCDGGGGGIRTHGDLPATPVFKTGAFNHSATPPWR